MKTRTKEVINLCKAHLAYAGVFLGSIVIFGAWGLIPHEVILRRGLIVGVLLAVTVAIWMSASSKKFSANKAAVLLTITDLAIATYSVFIQRGIASKSVFLFIIPILVATELFKRTGTIVVTAISAILYYVTCVLYFDQNPGQAYTVEVWGEAGFYAALLILVAYIARQLKIRAR